MRYLHLIITSALIGSLALLAACSSTNEAYLQPSDQALGAPAAGTSFDAYQADAHQRIKTALAAAPSPKGFLGDYDVAAASNLRAPYELAPVAACQQTEPEANELKGAGKGFLLVHGLTDSPYTLRNVADDLHQAYPCALIRSIILPGHGTAPGDTLKMTHEQWRTAVRYGINSFSAQLNQDLYLVGFSTGTSLIIDYLNHPNPDPRISGVVLLSAAVQPKSSMAFLAPILRHLKSWLSVEQERDATRYESFSFNAGAEFYRLTKDMKQPSKALTVPMLMAVSADDTTISAAAAREFFCYSEQNSRNLLVWYESADEDLNTRQAAQPELQCNGILAVSPDSFDSRWQTLNVAHTGVSNSPDDSHYGFAGHYHNCRSYKDPKEFEQCQSDTANSLYGEDKALLKKQNLLGERYFRRGTFNPDYDHLISRIICFADKQCEW
ncbi:MAG: alpha/beta hydrolase [Oceanobacter sp.]